MVRSAGIAAAVALFAALAALSPVRALAQDGVAVQSEEARNEFPLGVTFSLTFNAPAPPDEVRLRYELAPDGTGASAVVECEGGAAYTCTHTLTSGRGIFVIPGAQITYHWEDTDDEGNTTSTDDKVYVHDDPRFEFQPLQGDNITVFHQPGNASQAQAVLDAAVEALDDIGQLERTTVDFPVKVYLYSTAEEMQPAVVPTGGRGVTVLGEVVYSDTAMVSADVSTLDTVRHEIAHIVTREAMEGAFDIPDWMNEGISVFAQGRPLPGQEAALDAAIGRDGVLTMAELNSSAVGSSADTVGLYYGQAGSIIRFLVETYGPEKFADLLQTFSDGSTPDAAFDAVYGFDALGLENAWRESVGLAPRAAPEPTTEPTPEARAAETVASGTSDGSSAREGDDGDGLSLVTTAVMLVMVALLITTAAGVFVVVRERL
jgi:hypothetical protein